MSSYFSGNQATVSSNTSNPLAFPSYTSSQLQRVSLDKNNQNLSNLKHRLPLPQESLHHQNANSSQGPHARSLSGNNLANSVQSINNTLSTDLGSNNISTSVVNIPESDATVKRKERKNRPGQKFGAKKKSWVWTWFVQDTNDSNIAACDFCGKVITRLPSDKGSPKKLSEHLKTHKLTTDSINHSRSIPIDGNGITYTSDGTPMNFPQQKRQHLQSLANLDPQSLSISQNPSMQDQLHRSPHQLQPIQLNVVDPQVHTSHDSENKRESNPIAYRLTNTRRYLSTDFDNTPYSSLQFHRHLLKFLTENKLSINVLKSHSFQQLIYDLRSDSVVELLELTNLYSSLLEVSRYDNNESLQNIQETNVAQTISRVIEKRNVP